MRDLVREARLENGMKILTIANRASPTASLQVWYRVGSRNERTGITGASHIFEHMMFKGTDRFPLGAFDRVIQENGMVNNAFTTHDFTVYFENMASDRIGPAMELEADRMQGLRLDPDEFAREISVIREERRQTQEDPPYGLLAETVEATVFLVHPYHWPVIGWMTDLETIRLEDLKAYYRVYYAPNNAVLIVAGDVEHDGIVEMAGRLFGPIPAGPPVPPVAIVEPEQRGERFVRVHKDVQLPGLLIAYRLPAAAHADAAALNVAEYLLFRGRSSRLYQSLIYRRELAADLSGGLHLRRDDSLFTIRATARPGVEAESLRAAMLETVDSLATEPPGASEMEKVRNQLAADFIHAQENNFDLGQLIGFDEMRSCWEDAFQFQERCLEVGAEEVARVAGERLRERLRTTGTLVPDREGA